MAPLTIVSLFYLNHGWGSGHIWLHTTLEDPWPHFMVLEVSWEGLCTLSFGLSQFHGHGSWLVCVKWSLRWCPHHTKLNSFFVGGLVSHNDFHGGGAPLSNLYDGAGDGHDLHCDVHIWMRIGRVGPVTINLWYVHMAQLCCPTTDFSYWRSKAARRAVVQHSKNGEQADMFV